MFRDVSLASRLFAPLLKNDLLHSLHIFFTWGNIASVYKFMALWGIHVAFIESSSEVL